MNPYRQALIAKGLLTPKRKTDPDGPTPQAWRPDPTVRLDIIRPLPRSGVRCVDDEERRDRS